MKRGFQHWFCLAVGLALLASARAAELPLASVRYFNPYQHPTNWTGWGSAIYSGNGATVRNYGGTAPVDNVGGTEALVLDAVNPPGGYWSAQFKVSGNPLNYLRTGTNPAVHLRVMWGALPANGAWNMNVNIENAIVPLASYVVASTNAWQDIYIPTSHFLAVKPDLDLTRVWSIYLQALGNYTDHCKLYIAAMDVVPSAAQTTFTDFIKVNQVGYAPLAPVKLAIVSWPSNMVVTAPTTFQVVNVSNSLSVFSGTLTKFTPLNQWPDYDWLLDGDTIYKADFGAFRTPGTYRVEVPSLSARSQNFRISTNVYDAIFRDCLRFFYYSRAAVPIAEPFAQGYPRAAVHAENTNATYNYSPTYGHYHFGANTNRDVRGGWFDAGDTHMDVPNATPAFWYLLETLRDFPNATPPNSLNLPESNAPRPDLVPLITYALDWLQRMQNTNGSVHHYVLGVPNTAAQPQKVSDISSFATACAAGVFAKASIGLRPYLTTAEADDLLNRARLAWSWLQANPNMVQPRLPLLANGMDPGGDDPDPFWGDALADVRYRAFAAVELFEATGEAPFNNYFVTRFQQNGNSPLDGPVFGFNKTGYGIDNVMTYLKHPLNFAFMDYARSRRGVDTNVQAILKNAFLDQADTIAFYTPLAGYRIPMLYPGHLYWGSSGGVLAPAAMVLVRAFEWTGSPTYRAAAADALHFVCGRNPVNRAFVSGYGDYQHSSDFYSHFWTNLLHQPPGYVGGNINVDSDAVKPTVAQPWKRFINTQDADLTEPGVYWNAAFAWLAGYFATDAQPPVVQSIPRAGLVDLSWLVGANNYTLYTTTNLKSPVVWAIVTNAPVLTNATWRVSIPTTTAVRRYYRLQAP